MRNPADPGEVEPPHIADVLAAARIAGNSVTVTPDGELRVEGGLDSRAAVAAAAALARADEAVAWLIQPCADCHKPCGRPVTCFDGTVVCDLCFHMRSKAELLAMEADLGRLAPDVEATGETVPSGAVAVDASQRTLLDASLPEGQEHRRSELDHRWGPTGWTWCDTCGDAHGKNSPHTKTAGAE